MDGQSKDKITAESVQAKAMRLSAMVQSYMTAIHKEAENAWFASARELKMEKHNGASALLAIAEYTILAMNALLRPASPGAVSSRSSATNGENNRLEITSRGVDFIWGGRGVNEKFNDLKTDREITKMTSGCFSKRFATLFREVSVLVAEAQTLSPKPEEGKRASPLGGEKAPLLIN